MKTKHLMKGLFAGLLVASFGASAATISQEEFQPKVIYQDSDYIAKHGDVKARVATPSVSESKSSSYSSAAKSEAPAVQTSEPAQQNYWVGIFVLALAGLVFWVKRSESSAPAPKNLQAESAPAVAPGPAGETGVSRYMRGLGIGSAVGAAGTGVARYLKGLESTAKTAVAATGVARYLKNLEK